MDFEPQAPRSFKPFLPILFAVVLVAGVGIGYLLSIRQTKGLTFAENKQGSSDKINSLLDYIEYQYVDTVNRKDLVEKTVTAMLHSLDPHSDYIPAADLTSVNEPLQGNFDGIGIEFNILEDTIRVVSPISGGPSDKLGIKAGDKIVKVNGKTVAGVKITNKEVFDNLRGKRGTQVKITILRASVDHSLEFNITRDAIPIYSVDVSYIVKPGIGYIKVSRFAATTYEEYLQAFNKLSKQGMKKLILDLRGNPGGFLKAAVDIADEFLPKGVEIVYTQGKSNPKQMYRATDRGSFETSDLVVLIDEGSASASEIVAGAIQDNDRGSIVGRRSFGKGLVQDQMELSDGSAVRLTVARYYTPTGRCIQKPYNEGTEEYYNEEYERYSKGELLHADSAKLDKSIQYRTPAGRIVYGGGGIMPDVFVPLDTGRYTSFMNKAFYAGLVNSFAFEYADHHRSDFAIYKSANDYIDKYTVGNELLNAFYAYCEKNKLKVSAAEHAKTDAAIKPFLKAYLGRNLFDKDAYYPIVNQTDNSIREAVRVLELPASEAVNKR